MDESAADGRRKLRGLHELFALLPLLIWIANGPGAGRHEINIEMSAIDAINLMPTSPLCG